MTPLRTLLILALLAPSMASAQDLSSHPWAAWFGCWVPTEGTTAERPITCVVPSAGDVPAVEVITGVSGTVIRQSRIAADGVRVPFDQNGCAGWDAAEFSADGHRVYLSGEVTCGTRATQLTSGVYAFAPSGEWLDVQVLRTGDERSMRSQRLELIPLAALTAELREDFAPLERLALSARAAVLANPLAVAQVTDVAAHVDAAAAEIWLIESARGAAAPLRLRRAELQQLARANVPARVIDAAVAVANPDHFFVDVSAGEGLIAQLSQGSRAPLGPLTTYASNQAPRCSLGVWNDLYFQPSAFVIFMGLNAPFQYQWPYDANCFNPYMGRGWFDRSGALGYVVYLTPQPVTPTVTPKDQRPPTPRAGSTHNGGSVVSGRGYRAPSSGGTSTPASSSGSGTSSGTSSGSSGRTAKPRNP
jgi:hypothetical protein